MKMEKETGSRLDEPQLALEKKDLDICRLMIQMGIHPDKWLEFIKEKEC
ncbi:hypothetical protein [Paenibacillus sp. DMB20]|nr:hypothetical protein [Paenibacillus sp. DMB20]